MLNFDKLNNITIVTRVRYLPLLKQIMITLENNTLSIILLKEKLVSWSEVKLKKSEFYRNHNGILHKVDSTPTDAFYDYIDFLLELNLISRLNDFVRCTKYGVLFNSLHKLLEDGKDFSDYEKMFYLFILFNKDTENLLLILDYIFQQNKPVSQAELSKKYKTLLKIRLEHILHITTNETVRDKYLSLLNEEKEIVDTKKTKTVSKHTVPPRLEWLTDLGIIKETSKDVFVLSDRGLKLYNSIPKHNLQISEISLINNEWIFDNAISSFALLFDNKNYFKNIAKPKQDELLSKYIQICYEQINTDSVSRISTLPAFIFISIMLFSQENIILDFTEIKNMLINGIETGEYQYFIREAQRINESYISIIMK